MKTYKNTNNPNLVAKKQYDHGVERPGKYTIIDETRKIVDVVPASQVETSPYWKLEKEPEKPSRYRNKGTSLVTVNPSISGNYHLIVANRLWGQVKKEEVENSPHWEKIEE
jgi:hypothetical protein